MEKCHLGHHGRLAVTAAEMENGLNPGNVLNLWEMEIIAPAVKMKRRAVKMNGHAQVLIT